MSQVVLGHYDGKQGFHLADESGFAFAGWYGERFVGVQGELRGGPEASTDPGAALLDLYDRSGDAFAADLDGAFTLVLFDGPADRLLLYQDPLPGLTYLYTAENDGRLHFATSLRPLLRSAFAGPPQVDRQAIYRFLLRSWIQAPATGFEGVRQHRAGELLTATGGRWERRILDGWVIPDRKRSDHAACLAEYRGLLEQAIARGCEDPGNTVFLLSGGYDSSANVALARDLGISPLRSVGIGSEGFSTDAGYARRVAEICGAEHTEYAFGGAEIDRLPWLVWTMEMPYYEPGMMLTYYALDIARRHGRRVIGGEGTDQLFANTPRQAAARVRAVRKGYRWARRSANAALGLPLVRHRSLPRKIENRLLGGLDVNNWSGVYGIRACDLAGLLRPGWHGTLPCDDLDVPDDDLDALRDYGCVPCSRDYLLGGIIPIYGKLSGPLGVRPLSPYLDRGVRSFILSLDYSLRTPELPDGGFDDKRLHKDLTETLLDPEIFRRPKQGGAIDSWIHLSDDRYRRAVLDHLRRSEFLGTIFHDGVWDWLELDPRRNAVKTMMLLSLDLWHRYVASDPAGEAPAETLSEILGVEALPTP